MGKKGDEFLGGVGSIKVREIPKEPEKIKEDMIKGIKDIYKGNNKRKSNKNRLNKRR